MRGCMCNNALTTCQSTFSSVFSNKEFTQNFECVLKINVQHDMKTERAVTSCCTCVREKLKHRRSGVTTKED